MKHIARSAHGKPLLLGLLSEVLKTNRYDNSSHAAASGMIRIHDLLKIQS
jgi:hypothetical protein